MTTLILDDEVTEIDITGVTSFDVISHPGSLKWTVRANIGEVDLDLLTYESWTQAHFTQRSLTDHVIRDGNEVVIVDPETGSVVPQ